VSALGPRSPSLSGSTQGASAVQFGKSALEVEAGPVDAVGILRRRLPPRDHLVEQRYSGVGVRNPRSVFHDRRVVKRSRCRFSHGSAG
jgi:hypothetical protein